MNVESFENLELIPKLLMQIELMAERMAKLAPPLTSKKEVAKFLNKSERTINNYIEQGLLRENHHFYRKNGKILVFIEDAILKFRDERDKGIVK
ncbi:MAG: helix-turn-helix domain-containing protein [Sulfurimonas sp.]|uniref:helix-turn-helix domain-containing protein n=1 Tax=Sulfurimonas sp. TaxID=2022749 RepID=UPI002625A4C4|nr:helix-turn-helix domain-containing protein [Sulfurimonas sp.]MDD5400933.1 helix-turn-helix domain-containing protein [Sulfurimonas sp.]